MNLGTLFLVIALVLFLFAGAGVAIIPSPIAWGLFCMTLGLILGSIPIPWGQQRQ